MNMPEDEELLEELLEIEILNEAEDADVLGGLIDEAVLEEAAGFKTATAEGDAADVDRMDELREVAMLEDALSETDFSRDDAVVEDILGRLLEADRSEVDCHDKNRGCWLLE